MRLAVRVTPRGGRDAVDGWTTDEKGRPILRLRVATTPSDGQANAAVLELLSDALGIPKSALALVSGHTTRVKLLEVEGVTSGDLERAFGSPPAR